MQKTRQKILEYLKEEGEATVNDLSAALGDLTAVTVRHHLDVLRGEGLVADPEPQHRDTPGRPKYVYSLTDRAHALFPGNVRSLTEHVIGEIVDTLDDQQVNVIFEGVATRMASEMQPGPLNEPFEKRLNRVVNHLTDHGYEAEWEHHDGGYLLHTHNCPYDGLIGPHESVCEIDMRYISHLLGTVPRRIEHKVAGDKDCSYFIKAPKKVTN